MTIETYIREQVLAKRLAEKSVLVVYDAERRYQELCAGMASEECSVVDASAGSLDSRQKAISAIAGLVAGQQLLVYVPAAASLSDGAKQSDPFSIYAAAGAAFPDPERSGDNFVDLCLKAKPDHATEIRTLFDDNPNPSFDVINAIGGGVNWPTLQAALNAEGAANLLFELMVANDHQQAALKTQDSWIGEAKSLFSAALGLELKTKKKSWSGITEELWRFVLFSEFVFDLPEALPSELVDVPCAKPAARPIVKDLCQRLRSDTRYQPAYIEQAKLIESKDGLNLAVRCKDIQALGQRDTFPFEERSFLTQAIKSLEEDDGDRVREIVQQHAYSVWSSIGESQANWELIKSAQRLIETCDDLKRQLPDHVKNQQALIEYYQRSLRRADQLHREFERAVNDGPEAEALMPGAMQMTRNHYRSLIEAVQQRFTHFLQSSGWPPNGHLSNTQVFDLKVAPKLQASGTRVAYLMVDALRYELGVELHKQLGDDADVELTPAFSVLPSITQVGMASLLPNAAQELELSLNGSDLTPLYGGKSVSGVPARMNAFKARYGDRFSEMPLKDFVKARKEIDKGVDLLVLRSTDIDSLFENHPEDAPALMQRELKQIRRAVNKLQEQGFKKAVIVSDHGFYMNNAAEAGDLVTKPQGNWKVEHNRMLLGNGNVDNLHYSLTADQLGLRANFDRIAGPRSLAPYRRGMQYYHGGVSLQECLVPVLEVTLKASNTGADQEATVALSYKNGAKYITTRFAVIELKLESLQEGLFGGADIEDKEVLLEAHDSKGNVVGEAKPGDAVNAATGTVSLQPGQPIRVTLKMDPDFEGSFKVKAIDPSTSAVYGDPLQLKTDYAV